MFFTPGRVLGLIAFVAVVLIAAAVLKRLDALLSPDAEPAEDSPANAATFAAPASAPGGAAPARTQRPRPRKRRHGR